MSTPTILMELTYFAQVNGQNRLLYNEAAAKTVVELARPAYRLAVVQGKWPAGGRAPMEMQLELVKQIGLLAEASKKGEDARSAAIPALSAEEEQVANLLLGIFDYCAGRSIDLGRAMMLTHMHQAANTTRRVGS